MPSCPTKSFAESRCLRASPQNLRPPLTAVSPTSPTRDPKRIVTTQPTSTARKPPKLLRSGLARPRSNAKPPAARRPKRRSASAGHPIALIRRNLRRAADHLLHAAIAVVLFAFLLPLSVHAASAEASPQFEAGKQAFAAQDYAAALDDFEAAAAAGMSGPA